MDEDVFFAYSFQGFIQWDGEKRLAAIGIHYHIPLVAVENFPVSFMTFTSSLPLQALWRSETI